MTYAGRVFGKNENAGRFYKILGFEIFGEVIHRGK